ncbi:hypothetical protein Q5O24_02045 [Eubacteriaceae bacterium ES3]|nr:hypothetical protein Q5O24_02045 [Eubacteriaceae bacterium ES3]
MKKHLNGILIGVSFVLLSTLLYSLHYLLFHDAHHIFIYLLGDIAFLPVDVLLVSIIFHKIIEDRDKEERLKKINMVVGVFFSEVGVELIRLFRETAVFDEKEAVVIESNWEEKDYKNALKILKNSRIKLALKGDDLVQLEKLLTANERLFVEMLQNPIMSEHDTFSDLVLSISHAQQELSHRNDLRQLGKNDAEHIMVDIERFLKFLLLEWLMYMNHLKDEYPYMYSLLLRKNPLKPLGSVEIA